MSEPTRVRRRDKVLDGGHRGRAYVGLDVHKRAIHAAVRLDERIAARWVMPGDSAKLPATAGAQTGPLAAGKPEAHARPTREMGAVSPGFHFVRFQSPDSQRLLIAQQAADSAAPAAGS